MMIYFETARLLFRDWEDGDVPSFVAMNADSDVREFFPNLLTEDETRQSVQRIKAQFEEVGFGLYAVQRKTEGDFIGFIGFNRTSFPAPFTPCIEIGWRLKKEAWGQGYATEGARACLDYGWKCLGFTEIYSFTAAINHRSENVMCKIGMERTGEFQHPNVLEGCPLRTHVLYVIRKP